MRWSYIKKEELQSLQCTNPEKGIYLVALSPHAYKQQGEDMMEGTDIRYVNLRVEHRPNLWELKQWLSDLQKDYDSMNEVNGFKLGDRTLWLDKATRVGLVNSVAVLKKQGVDTIELWFGSNHVKVGLDYAVEFLDSLEAYAMQCYNVTASHQTAIKALDTEEAALAFDVTAGYPEQVVFDVGKIVGNKEV